MKISSRFAIGCVPFFGCIEVTKADLFLFNFYSCKKFFCSIVKTYPLVSGFIIGLRLSVNHILHRCCFPKIFPAIVCSVQIFMVNLKFWPFAGYIKPCKAMCFIFLPINLNYDSFLISGVVNPPHFSASDKSFRQRNPTEKMSRFFVVYKNATEIFGREINFCIFVSTIFHGFIHFLCLPHSSATQNPLVVPREKHSLCSFSFSTIRLTTSAIVIPRRLASSLRKAFWGFVKAIDRRAVFVMGCDIAPLRV